MDIVNYRFACKNVSLPLCHALYGKSVHAEYPARSIVLAGVSIHSPPTIALLLISLCMGMVLVKRTKRCYSFPGRKEFVLFLYTSIGAMLLEIILMLGLVRASWKSAYDGFIALQLASVATSFAALACTGFVWVLPTDMAYVCVWISRTVSLATFVSCLLGLFVSLGSSLGVGVFLITYAVPALFLAVFCLTQLSKLRQIDCEVWSYGTLFSVVLLALFAGSVPYIWGKLVVLFSERYIDGLFLVHLSGILGIIMVQKLWITDNEQEIECVNTVALK
jgi:Chitin synthase export chaperone